MHARAAPRLAARAPAAHLHQHPRLVATSAAAHSTTSPDAHVSRSLSGERGTGQDPHAPAQEEDPLQAQSQTSHEPHEQHQQQGQSKGEEKVQGKTQAQLDAELRERMEARAGDGGGAGVELEDGQPVAMKRGVRSNMFRYI